MGCSCEKGPRMSGRARSASTRAARCRTCSMRSGLAAAHSRVDRNEPVSIATGFWPEIRHRCGLTAENTAAPSGSQHQR